METIFTLFGDTALITAVTTILGSIVTYLVTKNNNKKDMTISNKDDRVQLSRDQIELISELRGMVVEQRKEISSMRSEMKDLQDVNLQLTLENKELQIRISKLNNKLDDMLFKKRQEEEGGDE